MQPLAIPYILESVNIFIYYGRPDMTFWVWFADKIGKMIHIILETDCNISH